MSDPSSQPTQPLTDEELDAMRQGYTMAKGISSDLLRIDTRDAIRLLAEVDRLRTWDGLMSVLDKYLPEDIWPTREDDPGREPGPRIVSLLRWVDRLRAENTAQAAKLAEIEQSWRSAELAWFAGVTVEHQLPIVMKHAAAMRAALGLDQNEEGQSNG